MRKETIRYKSKRKSAIQATVKNGKEETKPMRLLTMREKKDKMRKIIFG